MIIVKINNNILNGLKQCRDIDEAISFLKSKGINCKKEDLIKFKGKYNNKVNNTGALTMQQLDKVAGGLVLRIYECGRKEILSNKTIGDKEKEFLNLLITEKTTKLSEDKEKEIFGNGYFKDIEISKVNPWNVFENMYYLSHLDKREIANMTDDEKQLIDTMKKSKDNFVTALQFGAIGLYATSLIIGSIYISSTSNVDENNK